jgi:hypothetical protein
MNHVSVNEAGGDKAIVLMTLINKIGIHDQLPQNRWLIEGIQTNQYRESDKNIGNVKSHSGRSFYVAVRFLLSSSRGK